MDDEQEAAPAPEEEVARICADLIRFESVNYGDGSGPGERKAAEYVTEQLTEVGLDPVLVESEPGRASVMVRVEGSDPSRPGLAVHGHLDVVPAKAVDWQVDPFGAEDRDGCIWGRGAVDMKDMDAMIIANLRQLARTGAKPARTTSFVYFADEEAGGHQGSHWAVEHHPEWFEGVTEAISEVGGFSVLTGTPYPPNDPTPVLRHLGGAAGFVLGTLSDTSTFTMLDAGYKTNVIPQTASATLDCRFLPGHEDDLMATVRELAGEHVDVVVEHRDIALDSPLSGDLYTAMTQSL